MLVLDLNNEDDFGWHASALRRALRKGAKNGIEIEKSTDQRILKLLWKLTPTAKRHDFMLFSEDFAEAIWGFTPMRLSDFYTTKISPAKMQELGVEGSNILAQNFMILHGNEASYHYGVSSELGTKLSGAQPSWGNTRDAQSRGIKRYSFWEVSLMRTTLITDFMGSLCFKRGFGVDEELNIFQLMI